MDIEIIGNKKFLLFWTAIKDFGYENYFMEKLRDPTLLFLVKKDATGKITERFVLP